MDKDFGAAARVSALASLLFLFGPLTLGAAAEKSTEAGRALAQELCKDKQGGCNIIWTGDPKVPVLHADKCPRDHRRIVTDLPYKGDAVCVKTINADGEAVGIFDPTSDSWIPYESVTSKKCLLRLRCSLDNPSIVGDGTVLGDKPGPGDSQCSPSSRLDKQCHASIINEEYKAANKEYIDIRTNLRIEHRAALSALNKKYQADRDLLALELKDKRAALRNGANLEGLDPKKRKARLDALLDALKMEEKAKGLALVLAHGADKAKADANLRVELENLSGGKFKESSAAKIDALAREFGDKRKALNQEYKDKEKALRSGEAWKSLRSKEKFAQLDALKAELASRRKALSADFKSARTEVMEDFEATL